LALCIENLRNDNYNRMPYNEIINKKMFPFQKQQKKKPKIVKFKNVANQKMHEK
jgi:hypothetical protein